MGKLRDWAMSAGVGRGWGQRQVLVLGPGSALPYCVTSDFAFSFLSLNVLLTPTPGLVNSITTMKVFRLLWVCK